MADYNMNGFRVRFRIADYTSAPMVMAITATAEADEFDSVLTVNIGSSIGNGTLIPRNCAFIDINNNPAAEAFLQSIGAKHSTNVSECRSSDTADSADTHFTNLRMTFSEKWMRMATKSTARATAKPS